jgi:hypothetical protein
MAAIEVDMTQIEGGGVCFPKARPGRPAGKIEVVEPSLPFRSRSLLPIFFNPPIF